MIATVLLYFLGRPVRQIFRRSMLGVHNRQVPTTIALTS